MSAPFVADVEAVLAEVRRVVDRGREIRALPGRKGRGLGAESRRRLRELQAELEALASLDDELELAYRDLLEGEA